MIRFLLHGILYAAVAVALVLSILSYTNISHTTHFTGNLDVNGNNILNVNTIFPVSGSRLLLNGPVIVNEDFHAPISYIGVTAAGPYTQSIIASTNTLISLNPSYVQNPPNIPVDFQIVPLFNYPIVYFGKTQKIITWRASGSISQTSSVTSQLIVRFSLNKSLVVNATHQGGGSVTLITGDSGTMHAFVVSDFITMNTGDTITLMIQPDAVSSSITLSNVMISAEQQILQM